MAKLLEKILILTATGMRTLRGVLTLALLFALVGCGGGGGGSSTSAPVTEPTPPGAPVPSPGSGECSVSYDGTFDAIQDLIFARHGCTADACHGSARSGGLDLRRDAAYANLIEVIATGSALPRVAPGDNDRSYLWLKLAAKTLPGSVTIGGSPMPIGDTTLSEDELELVRLWIKGGAPETETVGDAVGLVDGCLPPPEPVTIRPLTPPPAGEGLQLVMPPYDLPAASEREVCFAQYYDVSDQVPPEYLNETGTMFRIAISDLRQDPESHHLILLRYEGDEPPSAFGDFTCRGGQRAGQPCDATDTQACGDGFCAGPVVDAFACVGFGPGGTSAITLPQILVAQQSQERQELRDGVYAEIPVRGLWVWNSHAFNLTTRDHSMNGRINYWFAQDQVSPVVRIFDISKIFAQSVAPFGNQTICNDLTLPVGTRLFNLISHTHKRGKHFWVDGPDGSMIYENFVYNDPLNKYYDPPLAFDSQDPAERTLHYCAFYENGLAADGSPDPATVKRRSITPENAIGTCQPVACTTGRVGEACAGAEDDAACESSPGAGDGDCDACVVIGGNSTEDEMFILIGAYYREGGGP
jgi:hypothetical protein